MKSSNRRYISGTCPQCKKDAFVDAITGEQMNPQLCAWLCMTDKDDKSEETNRNAEIA